MAPPIPSGTRPASRTHLTAAWLLGALSLTATATHATTAPSVLLDLATLAPARRLDFLEGDWITTTPAAPGSPTPSAWTTHVGRDLMGQVLTMESTGALTHFAWLEEQGVWKAVFLSPVGDFDTLQGGLRGGKIILDQPIVRGRPDALARTTFYDVHADGFRSDFESSTDGGETWAVDFAMFYQRVGARPNDVTPLRAQLSTEAPAEIGELDFLLGRWNLEYTLQMADGSTTRGRGLSFVHYDESGQALVEESDALFDSWISTKGRIVRTWDAVTGVWFVDRSSDHSPQAVRMVAHRTPDGLVEDLLGPEGQVQERIRLTLSGANTIITASERVAADGSSVPDGLMTVVATRLD